MQKDNHYFRLTSFYSASFLIVKGMQLVNIDATSDPRRREFVFRDVHERELWVHAFNFGKENDRDVLVDARKLVTAIRALKEKLHSDHF